MRRPLSGSSCLARWLFALPALGLAAALARGDDWPQWLGPQRDGVWRETGLLDKFPKDGPRVRWRVPIGAGYAGPAVAGGKVYVADRLLAKGARPQANPFDNKKVVPGTERVLCLNEADGKVLWKHEYDCPYQVSYGSGPRTTPLVHGGQVYTLGAMGDLFCFDAASGKVRWSKNFVKDYKAPVPMWGWAAHPLLDGDRLICLVGGEGSTVVAFHKDTGKELWKSLSASEPGYCPPMVYELGGKRQLIVWDPDAVNSLDPQTGKVNWSHDFPVKAGMTIPTPRQDGDRLFLTAFYDGSLMLRLSADGSGAKVVWQSKTHSEDPRLTDALHSVMPAPVIKDGFIYGVCSYGQLRCLKADTGERVWETLAATGGKLDRWANAFLVPQGDRTFLFNEKGDLIIARLTPRGYDEVSRTHLLDPDNRLPGRPVVWSHPAFANRSVYARNDHEIVCASLAAEK
jgi:outer membrane protein assembly factor BamB